MHTYLTLNHFNLAHESCTQGKEQNAISLSKAERSFNPYVLCVYLLIFSTSIMKSSHVFQEI